MDFPNRYRTGLIAMRHEVPTQRPPYNGAGWKMVLSRRKHERAKGGKEILIHAHNWNIAQRALNLALSSTWLLQADPPAFGKETSMLIAWNKTEPDFDPPEFTNLAKEKYLSTPGILAACLMASKASRNRRLSYAITKYNLSVQLHSVCCMDLEPHRSPHLPVSFFPDDHVVFCEAITLAYSAIEELGLEVRASNDNPSRLRDGSWNPEVLKDLQRRLVAAGVALDDDFLWILRGPPRRPERERPIPIVSRPDWSVGPVRDGYITIEEALSLASWLRSRVASHRLRAKAERLCTYDVKNMQLLARRLILEKMGLYE